MKEIAMGLSHAIMALGDILTPVWPYCLVGWVVFVIVRFVVTEYRERKNGKSPGTGSPVKEEGMEPATGVQAQVALAVAPGGVTGGSASSMAAQNTSPPDYQADSGVSEDGAVEQKAGPSTGCSGEIVSSPASIAGGAPEPMLTRRLLAVCVDFVLMYLTAGILDLLFVSTAAGLFAARAAFLALLVILGVKRGVSPGGWLLHLRYEHVAGNWTMAMKRIGAAWGPYVVLCLLSVCCGPSVRTAMLAVICAILLWYIGNAVVLVFTRGRVSICDHVSGTGVTRIHIRTHLWRWLVAWSVGAFVAQVLLVVVIGSVFQLLPQPSGDLTPSGDTQTLARDYQYTPAQLQNGYGDRIYEVQTSWTQKKGWLFRREVADGVGGTAFMIANNKTRGLLLSNRHVALPPADGTGNYRWQVRQNDTSQWVRATPIAFGDKGLDLSLLVVDLGGEWEAGSLPVCRISQIVQGERCVAIGNPLGMGLSITEGLVNRLDQDAVCTYIRTSAAVSQGNSGGPLILERGGRLAGVNTMGSGGELQNINLAIPIEYALDADNWTFYCGDGVKAEVVDMLRQMKANAD